MAHKGGVKKRQSVGRATDADAKRSKPDDEMQPMFNCIINAIGRAPENQFPKSVKTMLIAMVGAALRDYQDQRDESQNRVVEMISSVMEGIETDLEKRRDDGKLEVAAIEAQKVRHDLDRENISKTIEATTADVASKEDAVVKATTLMTHAKTMIEDAEKTRTSVLHAADNAEENITKLTLAFKEQFAPLKERSCGTTPPKVLLDALIKVLNDVGFDTSLLQALPSTIYKDISARTSFDLLVLQNMESTFDQRIGTFKELMANSEVARANHDDAVARARASFQAAESRLARCKDELMASQAANADALTASAALAAALKQNAFQLRRASSCITEAEAELSRFKEGAFSVFDELRKRSTPENGAPKHEAEVGQSQQPMEDVSKNLAEETP
eukprot:TRINITY_DN62445_c0_g1_i1.p1 TRINITY_DN62445_c0_g1~~TRINITY_DN62445_c0_g1_i1.p1  ORF type:complete len:388 (+),score=80.94 TRINITY_DN62445_c0_g1_i1:83-1246(+)